MGNLFSELKRRHIYRVAAAYAVVAWVLIQLVGVVTPLFDLPVWVGRATFWFLLAGFPIAMIFAWIHELAPAASGGALGRATTGKLDWALIGALIAVLALVSYQQLASSGAATAQRQAGVVAARAASVSPAGAISIAVLPFTNLSADKEQEFFSDGMTEEITSALAKIPDLRVVGRTSAFQFKGQNQDLRAIGQTLSATHLLEGSVRKAGNRVRITAELINADNGVSVWTDSYDRDMTDVFAIQEELARAIAGALRMPLGLAPGERLVSSRTSDTDSYEQFLRAKILVRARAQGGRQEVEALVARDPNFAPAWALVAEGNLAGSQAETRRGRSLEESRKAMQSFLDNGEMAARKAIELDPSLPSGYALLGAIEYRRGKWGDAESLLRQALALDADNPEALHSYGDLLANVGRTKEALALRVQLRTLEPFSAIYNYITAEIMRTAGQNAAGIAILEAMPGDSRLNYNRNSALAAAYAEEGQYAKAVDTILLIRAQVPRQQVEDAARLLRSAPAKVKAPEDLPALNSELNFVYAHIGALDRVMEFSERSFKMGNAAVGMRLLWDPLYAPLRKMERFKAFARTVGLVAYWRERGWPDLCRPMGANDFACE